jgi:hypothetical protein
MSIKKTREAKRLIESMAPQGEFLAFINDREAKMLKDAGGSGIMTAAGIPSFVVFSGPEAGGRSAADVLGAAAFEGTGGTGEGDSNIGQSPDMRGGINVAPTPKTLSQRIKDFFTGASRFSPTKAVTSGLGFILDNLKNLRGGLTQAQFERARDQRIARNRIQNILSRENVPFTELTQKNLDRLAAVLGIDAPQVIPGTFDVVGGPRQDDTPIASSDSLINRDPRLDGSFTLNIPQSGIVTQAPDKYRFTDAMARLNLERGVPRDRVFLKAEDFIDPSKTISSEDLGTIQSRIEQATGVPIGDIQLARNYTRQDLEKAGADTGIFGVNDELEALQEYYDAVQKLSGPGSKFAPGDPAKARDFITKQSDIPMGMGSYNIDMDLIPKDFLETQEDLQQQKSPFELFGK